MLPLHYDAHNVTLGRGRDGAVTISEGKCVTFLRDSTVVRAQHTCTHKHTRMYTCTGTQCPGDARSSPRPCKPRPMVLEYPGTYTRTPYVTRVRTSSDARLAQQARSRRTAQSPRIFVRCLYLVCTGQRRRSALGKVRVRRHAKRVCRNSAGLERVADMCAALLPLMWTPGPREEEWTYEDAHALHVLCKALEKFDLTFCALYHVACDARLGRVRLQSRTSPADVAAWQSCVRRDDTFFGWLAEACCVCALAHAPPAADTDDRARLAQRARAHEDRFYEQFARNSGLYEDADQLTLDALSVLRSKVECFTWVCVNALAKTTANANCT